MHYYRHHIGDFIRDTSHLSMVEEGAYRRLLDLYYLCDGDIPQETEKVFRRLRVFTEEEKQAVESVLNEFFGKDENGRWTHARCNKEIDAFLNKAEKARENGKLGGRPRKTKQVSNGFENENQKETEAKANHKPNNHKSSSSDKSAEVKWTEGDRSVAEQILKQVRKVAPSAKGGKDWPDTVRLMRERDGHSHDEILATFGWANNDDFWKSNILSPDALRKQWPKLEAKRNTTQATSSLEQYGQGGI